MEILSTEVSLSAHPALVTKATDHNTVVIFTKESMDAKKYSSGKSPTIDFFRRPHKKGKNGNYAGSLGTRNISSGGRGCGCISIGGFVRHWNEFHKSGGSFRMLLL